MIGGGRQVMVPHPEEPSDAPIEAGAGDGSSCHAGVGEEIRHGSPAARPFGGHDVESGASVGGAYCVDRTREEMTPGGQQQFVEAFGQICRLRTGRCDLQPRVEVFEEGVRVGDVAAGVVREDEHRFPSTDRMKLRVGLVEQRCQFLE
ncbi:hypothetical protein NJ76_24300 [Rhodococcus sp. IITR03]|nr:hypothetical protein NJ76_24300 [Rhodococcus sp. IITR03]